MRRKIMVIWMRRNIRMRMRLRMRVVAELSYLGCEMAGDMEREEEELMVVYWYTD